MKLYKEGEIAMGVVVLLACVVAAGVLLSVVRPSDERKDEANDA